jgi:hypothetical protein
VIDDPLDPFGLSDDDYYAALAGMDAALAAPQQQPGIGIPQGMLEAAAAAPAPVAMPEAPQPIAPPEGPATLPPEWLPPQGPPEDKTAQPSPLLAQPLGIPAHIVEDAALTDAGTLPPAPIDYDEGEGLLGDPNLELGRDQLDASLSGMSPVEAAEDRAQRDAEAKLRGAQAASAAAKKDAEDEERSRQAFEEAREQNRKERLEINAEAKQLANEKVGAGDWYEEGGIGRTVAAALMAIGGGLTQHLNGGRNIGVDMIDNQINRFIAAKQADRAHKRDMLGQRQKSLEERIADSQGDYRFAEVVRKASYARAIQQIEIDQQNFDPEGTQGRARDDARREMVAKMTAADAAAAAARLKQIAEQKELAMKEAKLALDKAQQAETKRNNEAQTRTANYGIASTNKREEKRLAFDEKKLAAEVVKDQRVLDKAEEVELRELGGLGDMRVKRDANNQPIIDPTTGKPEVEYDSLRNANKKPWKAPTKEVSIKLAESRAAAEDVVDMIDEVLAIRDRSGGESSAFNSDDRQRLDVIEAQILKRIKSGTQGMSSDEDMKVLKDAVGAKDVASFRDRAAGLEKGRERTLAALNKDYKVVGKYTGKPIDVENKYTAAPVNTKEEEGLKSLQKKPAISIDEADVQATRIAKKRYEGQDLKDPAVAKQFSADVKALKADYKDITPDQKADIARLGDVASGSGPEAEKAMRDLENITKGQTQKIREAALSAIQSAQMSRGAQ